METERVNAQAGTLVDAPELYQSSQVEAAPTNELGKDAFLKLLVAQLRYQDPLDPSSSEEFISTTAQFTVVEKLDELTKQGENTALVNSLTTASSLVGREITANLDGISVTAIVERSRIVSGAVQLETSAGSINLDQIVSVGAAPVPASVSAPTSTPGSGVNSESTGAATAADDSTARAAADSETQAADVPEVDDGEVEATKADSPVDESAAEASAVDESPVDESAARPAGADLTAADGTGSENDESLEAGTDTPVVNVLPIDSADESVSDGVDGEPLIEPALAVDDRAESSDAPPSPETVDPIEAVQPIETPTVPEVAEPAVQAPIVQAVPPAETDGSDESAQTGESETVEPAEPSVAEAPIEIAEQADPPQTAPPAQPEPVPIPGEALKADELVDEVAAVPAEQSIDPAATTSLPSSESEAAQTEPEVIDTPDPFDPFEQIS